MTIILDGKKVRDERMDALRARVAECARIPRLAILQIGGRSDSTAYIEQKKQFGTKIGVDIQHVKYEESVVEERVCEDLQRLNADDSIDGIIIQLPLPEHINTYDVIERIDPRKDVDGLTSTNVKLLQTGGVGGSVPATARGIETLLHYYDISIEGRHAVVVGRSQLVGTPTAHMLLNHGATVTLCHKLTNNLSQHTRQADILVVATGSPHLIKATDVAEGSVVVDVGINLLDGSALQEELPDKKFTGDVVFEEVKKRVSAISPVPGGVGPMTVLSLFENLLDAYGRRE